jgi:uncharacterized protein (UPF0332 family)
MGLPLQHERMNRVAKAKREAIQNWREGLSLVHDSRITIDPLLQIVTCARWKFARTQRVIANRLVSLSPPLYRAAISRYYYSMYHSMRACVFLNYGGDDHEAHTTLPQHIPSDFPSPDWESKLKDARLARNQADYDPYPNHHAYWKRRATDLGRDSQLLLNDARSYLRKMGCKL